MRIALIFLSGMIMSCIGVARAQTKGDLGPLHVGDNVPEYHFRTVLNYSKDKLSLSDFSGKLVILDFWSTGCSSCILSWPKLLQLQSEFEGKIQIVLFNPWESEEKVKDIFERRRKGAGVNMTLPSVCGDSAFLNTVFPTTGVPHVVWLNNTTQSIIGITYGTSLTKDNISALLAGGHPSMRSKDEEVIWPDGSKPLYVDGNGGKPTKVISQSVLSKSELRLKATFGIESQGNSFYVIASNQGVVDLYRLAYSRRTTYGGWIDKEILANVAIEVNDDEKYLGNIEDDLKNSNLYTYQLIAPHDISLNGLQKMMQQDLERYFGLQAFYEKRKKRCLVLTARDTSRLMYRSGDVMAGISPYQVSINKVSVDDFVRIYQNAVLGLLEYPVVNETRYKGLLTRMEFQADVTNLEAFNKALEPYGLRFTTEDRMVDVLVIRSSGYKVFDNN